MVASQSCAAESSTSPEKIAASIKLFFAQSCVAVAGYSGEDSAAPGNLIYEKLSRRGCRVFAVNPRREAVGPVACYPDLKSLPEKPGAVMICTPPDATGNIVRECAELGIALVWMHQSFGPGSVSREAIELCEREGIDCIPGGCPMMHESPDFGHRCMKWMLGRRMYASG